MSSRQFIARQSVKLNYRRENVINIVKAPGFHRIITVSDDINTMLLEVLQAVNDWK